MVMSDLDKEELEATRNMGKNADELSEKEIIQHFEFIKSGIKEETKFIDISILEYFEGLLDLYKEKNKQIQVEIEGRNILVGLNENLKEELKKEKEKNQELEEHHQQFYAGEMYTAKQVKNLDQTRKVYYIHRDKVREFALSESQADTYNFKTISLDRLLKFLEEE